MPELPEVEMIVRDLRSKIVGRRILGVHTDWPKYFRLPSSEAGFRACISGKVITAVDRRSKDVLISLTQVTMCGAANHGRCSRKTRSFRVDQFLEKEAIMNVLYFRFANSLLETTQARRMGRDEPAA
jgi:formamidopyrimidine-DNA glycosylase